MQIPLFHLVWNCFWCYEACEVQEEDSSWCRDELGLWLVGIRNMDDLKRGSVRFKHDRSGLFYAFGWFDRIFLWAEGFSLPDRNPPTFLRHFGSVLVHSFINNHPHFDKLLFIQLCFGRSGSKCSRQFYWCVCSEFCWPGIQSTVWLVLVEMLDPQLCSDV